MMAYTKPEAEGEILGVESFNHENSRVVEIYGVG